MDTIWSGRFGEEGEFTSNTHYSPARLSISVIKEQRDSYKVTMSLWITAGRTCGGEVTETPDYTETAVTPKCQGDRLTWLKPRSTTVPAHRTWDWGPAVFMSCRFCSRILGKILTKNLKSLRHELPQSRRNHCDTLFLISRTSFGLVFIGMNWLAAAAWRTPSSFDHCKEHTKESQTDILSETKTSKQKDLLKLCRLHKTKIKNHAELK